MTKPLLMIWVWPEVSSDCCDVTCITYNSDHSTGMLHNSALLGVNSFHSHVGGNSSLYTGRVGTFKAVW